MHARAIPVFVPAFVLLKRLEDEGAATQFWLAPRRPARRRGRGHGARGCRRCRGVPRHRGRGRGPGGCVHDGDDVADETEDVDGALGVL